MNTKTWMRLLAAAAALTLAAASGWAADPKAPPNQAPAAQQRGAEKTTELIDLNRATKAQLAALEGVGERTAQRIIQNRPYAKKDQLKSMNILTPQEYDRIKDKIIARQPPKKK